MTTGIISLIATAVAFIVANAVKAVIKLGKGNRDYRGLIASGGMPSVHTASVAALATVIGMGEGFNSAVFAVALVFLIVTTYDATHVRRATGEQGVALNKLLPKNKKQPYNSAGHRPIEALAGLALGVLVGAFFGIILLQMI